MQLAQGARTPQQRTMLLHIAETWLRLDQDSLQMGSLQEPAKPSAAELN